MNFKDNNGLDLGREIMHQIGFSLFFHLRVNRGSTNH